MIPEKKQKYLMYPLYSLYHIDDISSFSGLSKEQIYKFPEVYSLNIIKGIQDALIWVINNPDADLTGLLDGLPYTNKEIRSYLLIIEKDLRQVGK